MNRPLRTWPPNTVAPRDATPTEVALHQTVWGSAWVVEVNSEGSSGGSQDVDTPAPHGTLWLYATTGRTLGHLTSAEAFDLTSLCGRWFRHGYTRGEHPADAPICLLCKAHANSAAWDRAEAAWNEEADRG